MVAILGIGLLGRFLAQATAIRRTSRASGRAKGGGRSCLSRPRPGEYAGTYSDTVGKQPGEDRTEVVADRAPLQRQMERG